MLAYSTEDDISRFQSAIGPDPMLVCDLDGNLLVGYSITPKGRQNNTLTLGPSDNPKIQSMPFGTTAELRAELVTAGNLQEGLFSEKAMDSRLPKVVADKLNELISERDLFSLTLLTSRAAEDALTLLRESGVDKPEKLTLIADSGATLCLDGKKTNLRPLSDAEQSFLQSLPAMADKLREIVQGVVEKHNFKPAGCPELLIEPKNIAYNVHYREVLNAYGEGEGSKLDRDIGAALKKELSRLTETGPREEDTTPIFKTLDGPATIEVKITSVNKGTGLKAVVEKSLEAGFTPSSVVFSGDDVSKGNGSPGTDYYAMIKAPELQKSFNIPFFNVHTLHPRDEHLASNVADFRKSPATLSTSYPAPRIDLLIKTPREMGRFILDTLNKEPKVDPGLSNDWGAPQP